MRTPDDEARDIEDEARFWAAWDGKTTCFGLLAVGRDDAQDEACDWLYCALGGGVYMALISLTLWLQP